MNVENNKSTQLNCQIYLYMWFNIYHFNCNIIIVIIIICSSSSNISTNNNNKTIALVIKK